MKAISIFFSLILAPVLLQGQPQVQKINRENFIGQKVKFLYDVDNTHGYVEFGKSESAFPWLTYSEYTGRTATFIEKNNDLFTLKMNDNGELIYFKHYSFSSIPNNIGFFSLRDSARIKYLNNKYYNKDGKECKIVAIEFAEGNDKYSQIFGPYNVYYTVEQDTIMANLHFTETYGPENGYTYEHQRERVFENVFTSENSNPPVVKQNTESFPILKGPIGLSFGSSKDQVREVILRKGGKLDLQNSKRDVLFFDNVTIGLRKSVFVRGDFVDNKLYQVDAYFSTLEAQTQSLFDAIKSDLEGKYGIGSCYRNFKGSYYDGDGFEMQAVKLGNATISCFWLSFKDNSAITVEITTNLSVRLRYQDGKLVDEKIKQQNKIKSSEY